MRRVKRFLVVLLLIVVTQAEAQRFFHLTSSDGMSHDLVSSVVKGRRGFMWIGTGDGLNRYDGYAFTVYRHDPDDSNSIRDNLVFDVYERDDLFYIATGLGLDILDPRFDTFSHPGDIDWAVFWLQQFAVHHSSGVTGRNHRRYPSGPTRPRGPPDF